MFSFLNSLPRAARYFLAIEFSERASYYGYRSLLTRFLTTSAGLIGCKNFSEAEANAITHQNIAITYLMPVIGGIVADWFLGKYLSIIGFAVICCIGHLLLSLSFHYQEIGWLSAVFNDGLSVFQTGLVAIAIGAGGLKPNNSGLYGDQFQGTYATHIEVAYKWFYTAINVGSLVSFICIPVITRHYSYDWGFGVPGLLMALSTLILIWARKSFVHIPPTGASKNNFIFLNIRALWLKIKGAPAVWQTLSQQVGATSVEGVRAVWRVMGFFFWFILVGGVYEMNGSEWVNDARYLDRNVLGSLIPEESIQMVNSIFIILLVPLSIVFFRWLETRRNIVISTREKVFWGMVLVATATLVEGMIRSGVDQYLLGVKPEVDAWIAADPGQRTMGSFFKLHPGYYSGTPVYWQILAYLILTSGEILFSIGGLELGFRYAPPQMRSSVMSIWYLSTAFGNLLVSWVNSRMGAGDIFFWMQGANFYWVFAGLLLLNAGLYKWMLGRMPEKMYV